MSSTPPVLVTGGTGNLGRLVVPLLSGNGHRVRILSRRAHPSSYWVDVVVGDLATGDGIGAAVRGVATIVHCAGSARGDADKARTLVRAASESGVRHLVNISVVGVDRIPVRSPLERAAFGYYATKRAAELVVAGSGLGWTTLRATQFHDLILTVARRAAKLPVLPLPRGFRSQPVDAGEVASRLVELALGEPAGLVPDMAGPRIYEIADLMRTYLRATDRHRVIVPMPMVGAAARAFRAGANLAPGHAVGHRSWEDFLSDRLRDARN